MEIITQIKENIWDKLRESIAVIVVPKQFLVGILHNFLAVVVYLDEFVLVHTKRFSNPFSVFRQMFTINDRIIPSHNVE